MGHSGQYPRAREEERTEEELKASKDKAWDIWSWHKGLCSTTVREVLLGLPFQFKKMTQLSLEGSQYRVPDEWRNPDWISNFDNFPDPFFRHLHKEYDWIEKSSKGLLYGYIKQLAGKEYANNVYEDVPAQEGRVAKNNKANPHTYFLFAVGATKIINKPNLLRLPYYKKLRRFFRMV